MLSVPNSMFSMSYCGPSNRRNGNNLGETLHSYKWSWLVWWLQRSHTERKVFRDRIYAAYFSSTSERLDLAEENSDSQLFFFYFFIYSIYFFWPVAENSYYVPFPWRDTVIWKWKRCHTVSRPGYSQRFGGRWQFLTTCPFRRGFSRGRFESAIPHSCLGLSAAPDLHRSFGAQSIIIRKAFNDFVNS